MAFEFVGGEKMYPLQRKDELAEHHQIPNCQPDKSQQDPIAQKSNINRPVIIRQPPERNSLSHQTHQLNHEYKLKRIMHRDIERQRRQEMAHLYASLRTLLPLEYIKVNMHYADHFFFLLLLLFLNFNFHTKNIIILFQGKRSISDHMHEAVNYIKYLERSIGELRIRRDKLTIKKSGGNGNGSGSRVESFSSNSNLTVTVNPCRPDGLEILIGSNMKDGTIFPVSTVLKHIPRNQGINVVSCISTYANERLVHKILTEVPFNI